MEAFEIDLYKSNSTAKDYLKGNSVGTLGLDYVPVISAADIKREYIIRYFARQCNQDAGEIIEISKSQYTHMVTSPLYTTTQLQWRISGNLNDIAGQGLANSPERLYTGVLTANTLARESAEEILPGITNKLQKLTQYYSG